MVLMAFPDRVMGLVAVNAIMKIMQLACLTMLVASCV